MSLNPHLFRVMVGVLVLTCVSLAQNVYGSLTGSVLDPSGASIPGASVVATNTGTGARFSVTSNADGLYTLPALPVGVYDLNVESAGFQHFHVRNIRLQVNETIRVDATLTVGTSTETVTVEASAVVVDTVSPTLKTVVDQKRIEDLPLNGRNATQLMRLVVGTVRDTRTSVTSGTTYPGVTGVSVNGGRSNTTNFMLDGGQNNDHYTNVPNPMPNPDALQEFSVQTNSFNAEFGRQSGGIVNAVTKSGTNELHGSGFWFVRHHKLNSTPYFGAVGPDGKRMTDGLKRHQFGGTVGGPVFIPKFYDGRNKSFFFFSYQGTTERRVPPSAFNLVPTAAERSGDFSALNRPIRDPFANAPYANNRIPTQQLSPITQQILGFVPVPAAGENRITTSAPNNTDDRQVLVRFDHQFTLNNRFTARYWDSFAEMPSYLNPNNYLEVTVGRTWLNRSVNFTDTHTFGARVINQAMFSFTRMDGPNKPILPPSSIAGYGANLYNDDKPQWHITVQGRMDTLNTGDTNTFLRDEYTFTDTVRVTTGRHTMSFGGEYGRGIGDVINNFRANGQWTFNGTAPFTSDSLADFLIGQFYTLRQGIGEYRNTRFNRIAVFAQDDWKVSRRFTLNLGVRWEPFLPYTDLEDRLAVWLPGQQSTRYPNAPLGIRYAGESDLPKGAIPARYGYFAPRVGFALDVFGDGKTALRGGYGVFYDQLNTIALNNQANQAPFGTTVDIFGNLNNSFADPYAGTTNPFPAPLNPPSNTPFPLYSTHQPYAPDFQGPYVQNWNLTLERQVGLGFVGRASYAASKGTRLGVVREINPAIYEPGATTATTNQRRPYGPALGNLNLIEPVANSTYHALQLTADRRFSKGFSLLVNYQWAKAIDNASQTKLTGQAVTNPYDMSHDKGPADFDRRHVFNLSGVWELPFQTNGPARWLVNGWSLNAIGQLESGVPFTVASGVDNARTGTGGQRAEMIADPYFPDGRGRGEIITEYMRKSAFVANVVGTFGTLGRNTFYGPGSANWDFGMFKKFRVTETLALTYRFEAFNAFNRVNLGLPNSTLNSANFMRITSADSMRVLQMALRMTW
jgi:outer membrane receptor protein involved in Fe transport